MSGIFSDSKNTAYFDPDKQDPAAAPCQVVAVYNSNGGARLARDALAASGVPADAIHVIDRADSSPAGTASSPESRRASLLGAFSSLFGQSEDAAKYHLVADPKHALLVVSPGAGVNHARVRQVLGSTGVIEVYDCAS